MKLGPSLGLHSKYSGVGPFGITHSNTQAARTALQAAIANTGTMRWDDYGDSTTGGTGSDAPAGNGLRTQSRTAQVAALLRTRYGVTINDENVFGGMGKSTANYALYNPKFAPNSATFHATNTCPGGQTISHALTTGAARFTPVNAFDRCLIRWKGPTVGRDIVWLTSTGATGNLVGDGSFAIKSTELSFASATWIEFRSSVAAAVEFVGISTYNAAGGKILMNNCGWGGSTSVDWTAATGGGTRPMLGIPEYAPHLAFIKLGINDIFSAVTPATLQTNLRTLCQLIKTAGGNPVIITPNALNTAKYGSEAVQLPWFTAIRQVQQLENVPLIDVKATFVDWATANANGYMSDNEHMLAAGYAVEAALVENFIVAMMAA